MTVVLGLSAFYHDSACCLIVDEELVAIDVLECPRCHDRMQRLKFVTNADEIKEILDAIGYPGDSPSASESDCNPAA